MVSESPSPRFFVLEEVGVGSRYETLVDETEPRRLGKAARCPRCGDPIGMKPWLPPYSAELVLYGEELGDFIKASGDDLLISERFAQAFRDEGLTGLEGFHPVDILRVRRKRRGPKPSDTPRYLLVTACFPRAAVDLTRSRIRYTEAPPTCDECRSETKDAVLGFSLEPGTWREEDIFRPRGLFGTLVVSERFERFVTRHGFTNLRLTLTEEYVWNPLGPEPTMKPGSA
jgi:hypothetical protein